MDYNKRTSITFFPCPMKKNLNRMVCSFHQQVTEFEVFLPLSNVRFSLIRTHITIFKFLGLTVLFLKNNNYFEMEGVNNGFTVKTLTDLHQKFLVFSSEYCLPSILSYININYCISRTSN